MRALLDVIGWDGLTYTEQAIGVFGAVAGFCLYWTLRMALQALFGWTVRRRALAKKKRKAKKKAKVGGRR